MINIEEKSQCCGCSACLNICPSNAITMQHDTLGFLYPIVDGQKCINCGLCDKVCDFGINYDKSFLLPSPKIYGAWQKDDEERMNSQSGALFSTLAKFVLKEGGVVYGVALNSELNAEHIRTADLDELYRIKKSKYVQSDIGITFKRIANDLVDGQTVLFSGTPCQASGLRSFIHNKRVDDSKLYVINIICHGVPSPNIWKDNIKYVERTKKEKVLSANFLDKSICGWHGGKESYTFQKGKPFVSELYTKLYYKHLMLRDSCYICPFANFRHPGDITVGDFWGLDKVKPELDKEDKGVSLVIINTQKGISLFNKIKDCVNCFDSNVSECMQPNLEKPTAPNPMCKEFEQDYSDYGFDYIARKYGTLNFKYYLKENVKKIFFKLNMEVLFWRTINFIRSKIN
jgi:coenzyme F420-reducing hydrogenase beta subunit